jgi:hypothetical protein
VTAPAARLATRIWGTFTLSPQRRDGDAGPGADHYLVNDVVTVRGAEIPALAAGWHMTRVAGPGSADRGAEQISFTGTTQQLQYTDGAQQAELGRISNTGAGHGPGTVAVLIPITKSEAWWALPLEARAAPFRARDGHHTAIGSAFADRIFRRLYHARFLPGATWDFLTYFEMRPEAVPAFRQLLAQLRDPAVNPEWSYVDREVEIWTVRA